MLGLFPINIQKPTIRKQSCLLYNNQYSLSKISLAFLAREKALCETSLEHTSIQKTRANKHRINPIIPFFFVS